MRQMPPRVVKSAANCPCIIGRHQRAHHQRHSDGHAHPERHAQVPHRQPVAHVAHAPHRAEECDLDQQAASRSTRRRREIRAAGNSYNDRQKNPREEAASGPGGFPRPSFYFFNRCVKRRGKRRTNNVPPNPRQNRYRHSISISICASARTNTQTNSKPIGCACPLYSESAPEQRPK